jgi:sigma-B regulation protein RsbU (phosphoserine phosphatase)
MEELSMSIVPQHRSDTVHRPRFEAHRKRVKDLIELQEAARKINSILDLDQLLDHIVNNLALSFGCVESVIALREQQSDGLVVAAVHGCSIHLKGTRFERDRGLIGHVAQTGLPYYAPDVSKEPRYVRCELDTRSELELPLKIGERVIGVFSVAHPELDGFSRTQRSLLQQMAVHIAVAIENAQLFQKERNEKDHMLQEQQEARQMQQSLLPKFVPQVDGIRIEGQCVPAGAVGGDWYDYIPLADGKWALVLADVSGKGMGAAMLMAATRAIVRTLAKTSSSPGAVLWDLNRILIEDFPQGKFVTMIFAVLDPKSRTLRFANAGHPQPLFWDGNNSVFLSSEAGLPLGIQDCDFSETTVELKGDFKLLFYSDGITEARSSSDAEYGTDCLQQTFSDEQLSADAIMEEICLFSGDGPASDDATVILLSNR